LIEAFPANRAFPNCACLRQWLSPNVLSRSTVSTYKLRDILTDNELWARRVVLNDALRRRDTACLVAGLSDPDHRHVAARYLGRLRDPASRIPLERLFEARDPHMRAAAVRALGNMRARDSAQRLIAVAQTDSELFVRLWAIEALVKVEGLDAVPVLHQLLDDDSERVRLMVVRTLGHLRARSSIATLRAHARREPIWIRVKYWPTILVLQLLAGFRNSDQQENR